MTTFDLYDVHASALGTWTVRAGRPGGYFECACGCTVERRTQRAFDRSVEAHLDECPAARAVLAP